MKKNGLKVVIFYLALVFGAGCGSGMVAVEDTDQQVETSGSRGYEFDRDSALRELGVSYEGLQVMRYTIYSAKCQMSATGSVGNTFAESDARAQIAKMCPNQSARMAGTQVRISRKGDYSCVLVTLPKSGLICQ